MAPSRIDCNTVRITSYNVCYTKLLRRGYGRPGICSPSRNVITSYSIHYTKLYDEKVDVRGTIRAALTSTPTLSRVYILNERTETGKALDELMKREIAEEAPDTAIYTLSDYPVNAIERIVSILPDDSIVLLGAYFADLNQHEYSVGSTVRRIAYASSYNFV